GGADRSPRLAPDHDRAHRRVAQVEPELLRDLGKVKDERRGSRDGGGPVAEDRTDLALRIDRTSRNYGRADPLVSGRGAEATHEPGVAEEALVDVGGPDALRVRHPRVQVGPALEVRGAPAHRRGLGGGPRREVDAPRVGERHGEVAAPGRRLLDGTEVVLLRGEGKPGELVDRV